MKNKYYYSLLLASALLVTSACKKGGDSDPEIEPAQTTENTNSETSPDANLANNPENNPETPSDGSSTENPTNSEQQNSDEQNSDGQNNNSGSNSGDSKTNSTDSEQTSTAPNPSENGKEYALGKVHNGTAVISGEGANSKYYVEALKGSYITAAINEDDYKDGVMAGSYLEVTGPKGSVKVLITDVMGAADKGTLGLTQEAFDKIAKAGQGTQDITWKVIPLPTKDPVSYYYIDASEGWFAVQILNHRYPIEKLEVKVNGKYTTLERKDHNVFVKEGGLGKGPLSFRITDIYGHVIEDANVTFKGKEIVEGNKNFK